MTMITFSENHESNLIAFEEGQALASLQDPHAEALRWVYSLGVLPSKHIVVVGLGSGFHVAAMADVDPEVRITVIESRESLIQVFKSQFADVADRVDIVVAQSAHELQNTDAFEEVLNNRSYVVSFRECWGGQETLFTEFFAHLTGRSLESVRYHLAEIGINMKALYLDPRVLHSMTDVLPIVEASQVDESKKQIFRALGELVK
ncbi:hypothetical protein D3C87_1485500 [compost metagenome]